MVLFWYEKCSPHVGKDAFINSLPDLKILLCWKRLFLSYARTVYFNFQPHQYLTLVMIIVGVISQLGDPIHELTNALIQNRNYGY